MDFKYSVFIFVILLNFIDNASCQGKCEKQGVNCTSDCSGIIACTESGADPILLHTCDSTDKSMYCLVTGTEAACNGTTCIGTGGGDDINVKCGSLGELPHPTKCGFTVKCTEVGAGDGQGPSDICNCPANAFIDIMRPSLPCKTGKCPRQPVKCDAPGKFGKIQEGSDFYYICGAKNNNEVIDSVVVFLSDAGATKSLMPELRASVSKTCGPINPSNPDPGSG